MTCSRARRRATQSARIATRFGMKSNVYGKKDQQKASCDEHGNAQGQQQQPQPTRAWAACTTVQTRLDLRRRHMHISYMIPDGDGRRDAGPLPR